MEDNIFNEKYDLLFLRKILIYLLDNSLFVIAQKVINRYFTEDTLLKILIDVKLHIINGSVFDKELNIDTKTLLYGIQNEIIDVADLLVILWDDKGELYLNKNIQVILEKSNVAGIYRLIFNKLEMNNEKIETQLYIAILEKCIKYKKSQLINNLINIAIENQERFNFEIMSKLGNLLYSHSLSTEALHLYERAKETYSLDTEAINNIVEYFYLKKHYKEALTFIFYAFEQNKFDFRILKNGIIILDKLQEFEDKDKLILMGMEIYSDSQWLRNEYLKN